MKPVSRCHHDGAGATPEGDRALTQLMAWWSDACEGHGRIVLVGGEPGIGKTTLTRELARAVSGRQLLSICDPPSVPGAAGPLVEIATQIGGTVAQCLADGRFDAVLAALVAELAVAAGPTLIVIDDAQWADPSSLGLVLYLGRRIGRLRALLVVTFRDDELEPEHPLRRVLGDLATCDTIRRLHLDPLSLASVRRLVAGASGSALDAAELHRRSGGVPFLVVEALAAPGQAVPITVRDAVMARVARLPVDERAVLEATAVLGARACREWLEAMVSKPDAIAASLLRGIVRADGAAIEVRHELERAAVLAAMPAERRRSWHACALAALAADPRARYEEPAMLADHADGAGDLVAARDYRLAAARAASQQGAHQQAAEHYEHAQRHRLHVDDREHLELLELHARERYFAAEVGRAFALWSQAADHWQRRGNPVRHGAALAWLSRLGWLVGRTREARDWTRQSIEILAPLGGDRALAAAYSEQAQFYLLAGEPALSIRHGRRAVALARQCGDPAIERLSRCHVAIACAMAGDPVGIRELQRRVASALETTCIDAIARLLSHACSALVGSRDLHRATSMLERALAHARAHNLEIWSLDLGGHQALVQFHRGQLAQAVETAMLLLQHPGLPVAIRIQLLVIIGRARARRGEADAWSPLDEALALVAQFAELPQIAAVRTARGEAALLDGNVELVRAEVMAALPLVRRAHASWLCGELMVLLALAGDEVNPPPWLAPPFASYLRGQHADAAAAWYALGCPYEQAWSLAGSDAEPGLRAAFAILDSLGMVAAAAHISRRLHARGARRIPRGPRASTRANVAGLTVRETEVLALVTEGLKDVEIGRRLFISPKTVGHHISAILRKLDVRDRAAAGRRYRDRGTCAPGFK